jgi:hypothetical protein
MKRLLQPSMTRGPRILSLVALAAAAVAASHGVALAQLKGHYVAGFTGLGDGSQGPPSISVILPLYFYTTDTIKDDSGNMIGDHARITASFIGPGLVWVTNTKIFGGTWGGQAVPIAYMKSRIESNSLDVPGSFAFSDLYLQPLQLGWQKARADYAVGWGIFFPTGKWELGGNSNAGLGMWSNDFQAGTTLRLDAKHAWTTSLLATYEIHSHKKGTDIKAGDILTLEGGTGKAFYKTVDGTPIPQIMTLGVAYYGQFKVSSDTGSGPVADVLLSGKKDQVFGAGLEGNVFLPKTKLLLDLRVVPEFGARNRSQGTTFLFTLAYQAKSLMKNGE